MAIQRSDCCVMSEERQKERGEICPVESIIEWWHNGAYTPSKDCVISIKQLKKQTLLICLWACFQITAKCICSSAEQKNNRLMILSVFNTQILCIISHWGLTSQGNSMQGKNQLIIAIFGKTVGMLTQRRTIQLFGMQSQVHAGVYYLSDTFLLFNLFISEGKL